MTEMTFMVYICKKNWQQRCKLKNQSMSYNLQAEYSAGEELSHTSSLLHPSSSTVKIVSFVISYLVLKTFFLLWQLCHCLVLLPHLQHRAEYPVVSWIKIQMLIPYLKCRFFWHKLPIMYIMSKKRKRRRKKRLQKLSKY